MAQILVPFDFSSTAVIALDQAMLIAQTNGVEIEVLHITNEDVAKEYPESWECTPGDKPRLMDKILGTIDQRKSFLKISTQVNVSVVIKESAVISGGIIKRAMATNAILLVMGTHGITGFKQAIMGSNVTDLINSSLLPVLAIPPHWQAQVLKFGVVAAELKDVDVLADSIRQWSRFFHVISRVVQFTPILEIHKEFLDRNIIGGVAVNLVQSDLSDSLAQSIAKYVQDLEETVLIMFVHERKRLERIFDFSKTERAARIVSIPLLAIPKESE